MLLNLRKNAPILLEVKFGIPFIPFPKLDFNTVVSGIHYMISATYHERMQTKINQGEKFDDSCA